MAAELGWDIPNMPEWLSLRMALKGPLNASVGYSTTTRPWVSSDTTMPGTNKPQRHFINLGWSSNKMFEMFEGFEKFEKFFELEGFKLFRTIILQTI
jgi:hypothetical protein